MTSAVLNLHFSLGLRCFYLAFRGAFYVAFSAEGIKVVTRKLTCSNLSKNQLPMIQSTANPFDLLLQLLKHTGIP